jgi:hypothetical protein
LAVRLLEKVPKGLVPISVLVAEPPVRPLPPVAVCVRLSVPVVAPPIASFTPPLLIRLTDPPLPKGALPPIAVPDTVTVPPVTELPKTAGPRPPLDRVAEPPAVRRLGAAAAGGFAE